MSNDAKLGLVLGVAVVLVIALVFFRSDPLATTGPTKAVAATASSKDADALVRVTPINP